MRGRQGVGRGKKDLRGGRGSQAYLVLRVAWADETKPVTWILAPGGRSGRGCGADDHPHGPESVDHLFRCA